MFHTDFNSKARGVAVLFGNKMQFSSTKVITDKNGCYVFVVGVLFQTPVLQVNIYAPNFDDVNFAHTLLSNLPFLNTHLLILGGNLNCVINPALDRSTLSNFFQSNMSKAFSDFMNQNGFSLEISQSHCQRVVRFL